MGDIKLRITLFGSSNECILSISPYLSIYDITIKSIDSLIPDCNDKTKFGLFIENNKKHYYLSQINLPICSYDISNGFLILKIKPLKIPIFQLRYLYIDSTEPLVNYNSELLSIMGYNNNNNIQMKLLQRKNKNDNNNIAFGTKRGICLLNDCDCNMYQKSDSGECKNCGHYPSKHKNLGVSLLDYIDTEYYNEIDNSNSLCDQGISFLESDEPLLLKSDKEDDIYINSAIPISDPSLDSNKSLSLSDESNIRRSSATSRFKDVLQSIASDNSPRLKKWAVRYRQSMEIRPVFGASLEDVMSRENETFAVPSFVVKIIRYLEDNALDHPGLFRLSGNQDIIDQVRLYIDQGRDIILEEYKIDVISSVLKQYLQALPEPILTNVLYARFITMSQVKDKKLQLEYLTSLVNTLPAAHLDLLRYLLRFLIKVIEHEENNKMSLQNVSIVFGPILMRSDNDNPQLMLSHASLITIITELVLQNYSTIFCSISHSLHTVKALNPYTPKKGQEGALEVEEGSIIHVFKKDNLIWYGEIDGRVGSFPRADITRSSKVIIIKDQSNSDLNKSKSSLNLKDVAHSSYHKVHFKTRKNKKEKKEKKQKEVIVDNPLFGYKPKARRDVVTKTLPKGFDPQSFESYLKDNEYENLFGISKTEYFKLPIVKRNILKQQAGLC